MSQITTIADLRRFILAGKAVFTVENTATGGRFTFRVRQADARGEDLTRCNACRALLIDGVCPNLWEGSNLDGRHAPPRGKHAPLRDEPRPWFVAVLTGPDNTRDFTFLGTIFPPVQSRPLSGGRQIGHDYHHGKRSKIASDATSAQAWIWLWKHVLLGRKLPKTIRVFHEGRCGRCGRTLTVPSSITTGLGPECAEKV